jgi:hypothetical protein
VKRLGLFLMGATLLAGAQAPFPYGQTGPTWRPEIGAQNPHIRYMSLEEREHLLASMPNPTGNAKRDERAWDKWSAHFEHNVEQALPAWSPEAYDKVRAMFALLNGAQLLANQLPADQLPANQRTRWFHGALWVGSVNKGTTAAQESWGEVEIQNHGKKAETLELTARRYNGKQVMHESYEVAPGEKRTVRVEDPSLNVLSADGRPIDLSCTVLIEPAPPTISITLRQLGLYGDQLKTATFGGMVEARLQPVIAFGRDSVPHWYTFSNIGDKLGILVICDGYNLVQPSCSGPSRQVEIPPFSTQTGPFKAAEPLNKYMLATRSPDMIVMIYREVKGTISTFNAESSITFGGTVKQRP